MARQTTEQKDAFERLRGNPVTPALQRDMNEAMREASEVWRKRSAQVIEAVACHNPLLAMEVPELERRYHEAVAAGWEWGTDSTGWVNPYPKDDPRSLLLRYQFTTHHDDSDNICNVDSRQTGKGFTIGLIVGEKSFKVKRNRNTITSPSERQSLLTFDKVKDAVLAFGLLVDGDEIERDGSHPQSLITSKKITLSNGSTVRGVPGLPQTLRGDTGHLTIDEGDHIENPTEFMRAVIGIVANEMAGKKQIRYITTPLGKNAPSWKYFNDPSWKCRRINIWQAILMGIKQNPDRLRKLYGDDIEGWAQEMLCEWLDSASVLLPYELIATCESLEASEGDTPEMLRLHPLRKVAGIDFGRVSDPTVMVTALNGLGINIVRNITKLQNMSTPVQIDTLAPYIELCSLVEVDYTGPGIGFGDLAVQRWGEWKPSEHKFGKIKLVTTTLPIKRVMYPRLRTAFEKRNIRIPICTWLREELHSVNIVLTNGQYNYKAPRTDDGHSDGCTATAHMQSASEELAAGPFAYESTPRGAGGYGGDPGGLGGGSPYEARTPVM